MRRLVQAAEAQGVWLRLVGGLAVKVHSPQATQGVLGRVYADMDFVVEREGGRKLAGLMPALGYQPNKAVNTLQGDRRQLYYHSLHQQQIDIFVGDFEMCHKIPLNGRLRLEPFTIPLAELFLTKAQIVHLNQKDAFDLFALLLEHPVGKSDQETINHQIIANLCAQDWGLYTTLLLTLQKLEAILAENQPQLTADQTQTIHHRLQAIHQAAHATPRSTAWQLRAKLGTRLRWYNEVEEVNL